MDCNVLGSSVHGILQAIPFFRGSSQPRDGTWVSHIAGRFFIATRMLIPWYKPAVPYTQFATKVSAFRLRSELNDVLAQKWDR